MSKESKFIEGMKEDWGQEFAAAVNVKHRPEHDSIVAMSCYTMAHHIADNFRDGKFRAEILDTVLGIKTYGIDDTKDMQ
jgi:hypothetical protein